MITVLFSCPSCGLKDEACQVRPRYQGEDVVSWVKNIVGMAVAIHHQSKSPKCSSAMMSELKIPIDKDDPDGYIGKQTDRVPPKGK